MKIDGEFIKEMLDVAFPGHEAILCIAVDGSETAHGFCNAPSGKIHEQMMQAAIETIVIHLFLGKNIDLRKIKEKNESHYWTVLGTFALTQSMSAFSNADTGYEKVVDDNFLKTLEKLIDFMKEKFECEPNL